MLEISKHKGPSSDHPEEEEAPEDELLLSPEHRSVPSLKHWSAVAVVAAGCGLAGSREPWAYGIVALLIAVNLLIAPPRIKAPPAIVWPLAIFVLLALGSFLPLSESGWPRWRLTLVKDFGIDLGGLRSPQPWISFETWIIFAVEFIWIWHCLGRGFNGSERRWIVRMLSLGVALLATLAIWFKHSGIDVPFWQARSWRQLDYFGPFPNRNNFGGLAALGAVLTFASVYDLFRRRSGWWALHALCLVPIIWALVANTSRAGIGLFFLGLMAWMAFASFSKRSARRMGVAAALLITLVTVVILFGQHILNRVNLLKADGAIHDDARVHVWSDCISLIKNSPILGSGLGNFADIFPFYQTYYDSIARYIHPENDWLWNAAEVGAPAVLMVVVALASFVRRTGIWRKSSKQTSRKDRRLRNACAISALILPLQSIVDTPAHQIGMVAIAALLAGLSLHPRHSSGGNPGRKAPVLRFVFAALCSLVGFGWLAVARGYPVFPGESSATMFDLEYDRMRERGDLILAKNALNHEMALKPLHYYNYYERGSLSLARGLPPNSALEDFARMRFLEPHLSQICFQEALVWLKFNPSYAPAAWREAMRRDIARADYFYVCGALAALREHPEIRRAVWELATTPLQKLGYLETCDREEFTEKIAEILESHPTLEIFSSKERLRLFQQWFASGNRAQLLAKLESDADWRADGWPVLAQGRAAAGDFRGAYQLALENLPPPAESGSTRKSDIAQLRRDFLFHPSDFNYGFALFEAESAKGLTNDALVTLDKVAQIPNAPIRVFYEQAVLLSRKGDHAAAWEKMKTYIDNWQVSMRDTPTIVTGANASKMKSAISKKPK
jgi:hypothetical protein